MLDWLRNWIGVSADPAKSHYPLVQYIPSSVDFADLKKGIDNLHIDVALSPRFIERAGKIVVGLLDRQINRGRPGEKAGSPTPNEWELFHNSYRKMLEEAINRAKQTGLTSLVPLVQVASLKYLNQLIASEIEQRRLHMKAGVGAVRDPTNPLRSELNERISWLAKNRLHVRGETCRQVFEHISRAESGYIADLRQSLLGERWSLALEIFSNRLLSADNPLDEQILMSGYVLLGDGAEDPFSFEALDGLIPALFKDKGASTDAAGLLGRAEKTHADLVHQLEVLIKERAAGGGSEMDNASDALKENLEARVSEARLELEHARIKVFKERYSWATAPQNVDTLFNVEMFKERVREEKQKKNSVEVARLRRQIRLQKRLRGLVERRFLKNRFVDRIIAAYETAAIHPQYSSILNPRQLLYVLAGLSGGKEILKRLKDMPAAAGKDPSEDLRQRSQRIDTVPVKERQEYLVRFLRDFVRLKHDLGVYYMVQDAMSQIAIQKDPKNLRLSKANTTLYEFYSAEEGESSSQSIINHVILKADIRGSTRMVEELRSRGLNPASHFGLKLFEPINDLLHTYGANKVFIEGDAIILSISEYEGPGQHRLAVSRACGLARRLLNVVQAENSVSRNTGLPELELGIGLVYSPSPPTFLYDGDNPIMISTSIGKADRLSSCSWILRERRTERGNSWTNVEVYELPEGDHRRGEKGDVLMRFNVNGVEMDHTAFEKLRTEIKLTQLNVKLPGEEKSTLFYAGRFPDVRGNTQHLIIRVGIVRVYDPNDADFGKGFTKDAYYEVVTNDTLITKVNEALKAAGATG